MGDNDSVIKPITESASDGDSDKTGLSDPKYSENELVKRRSKMCRRSAGKPEEELVVRAVDGFIEKTVWRKPLNWWKI